MTAELWKAKMRLAISGNQLKIRQFSESTNLEDFKKGIASVCAVKILVTNL
jgi:hypothetical protein